MNHEPEQDGAAEAFEALRSEVALLRRALEGLAAERSSAPDYALTIEKLVERQDNVAAVLKRILASPAVQTNHETFGAMVQRTSEQWRLAERKMLENARDGMDRVARQLEAGMERARTAAAQRDALIWTAVLTMGGTGAVLAIAAAFIR